MKSCAAAILFFATTTIAAVPLSFADLKGWWCAEPTHGGESSKVCVHFLEEDGKQAARLSLPAIGGHDVSIGIAEIDGQTVDFESLKFQLEYNDSRNTLRGVIPEAIAPIYKIPIEFTRAAALDKPASGAWNLPRAKVTWFYDTNSAVWAGLEHDAETDLIFVANDAGAVISLDRAGKQHWSFSTDQPIKARPSVIGPWLLVTSDSGFFYKLDKRTGREQWRARVDSGSPPRVPPTDPNSKWDRYGSSAIADATRVFVASRDKHLYALDIRTGAQLWRVSAGDIVTATPVLYRDLILFAAFDGKVTAVSAIDGKERWTYDAKLAVPGDLTVAGDRVYLGSRTYDLIALDAASGKELWKRYYWFSWIESPPVVRDGTVYTGSSDALGVFAFDATSGATRWKARVPGWAWSRPAVGDELIVVGTVGMGGYLGSRNGALVGIDRASGTLRWIHIEPPDQAVVEKRTEWGFAASPLIVGKHAYAADLRGRVYAIDLASAPSKTQ